MYLIIQYVDSYMWVHYLFSCENWLKEEKYRTLYVSVTFTVYLKEPVCTLSVSLYLPRNAPQKKLIQFYYLIWFYLSFCRQHQFAIRATVLSAETLKARNIYLDAAMQFMRMTAEVKEKYVLKRFAAVINYCIVRLLALI